MTGLALEGGGVATLIQLVFRVNRVDLALLSDLDKKRSILKHSALDQ